MPTIIDSIELDPTNEEFNQAADFACSTDKIMFLTGKAGTGKTTFIKYIRQKTTKKTIVLSPTSVATINAGGQTIHSFFKIKPSVYVPDDERLNDNNIYRNLGYTNERRNIIRETELLIIDESLWYVVIYLMLLTEY